MTPAQLLDLIDLAEAEWAARPRWSRIRIPGLRRPDAYLELTSTAGPTVLGQRGAYLRDAEPPYEGAPPAGLYTYTRDQAALMRWEIERAALVDAGLAPEDS